MRLSSQDLEFLLETAQAAGDEIMRVYASADARVEYKDDESPLTRADARAQEVIVSRLRQRFPSIPLLAEEQANPEYCRRSEWEYFWLVDPLDGTKEFLNRNGEFTVNIALIRGQQPYFGIVGVPARAERYYAGGGYPATKRTGDGREYVLKVHAALRTPVRVVRSRSHPRPEEVHLVSALNGEVVPAGSALKFCLIAEGKADLYLRAGPTMEWDTAAGHCVAQSAGARMRDLQGEEFVYNKKSLKNPGFVCAANSAYMSRVIERKGC
ncbi:MAG: 3'(2'),5'-bisphosphate nucleotidase CysQ [Candidatus Omnitrophica bacterium]|nr:3'(2'),5'-bisphosphate nucleotidase CysQ [Candidatus Omnitrophota bacterium]